MHAVASCDALGLISRWRAETVSVIVRNYMDRDVCHQLPTCTDAGRQYPALHIGNEDGTRRWSITDPTTRPMFPQTHACYNVIEGIHRYRDGDRDNSV